MFVYRGVHLKSSVSVSDHAALALNETGEEGGKKSSLFSGTEKRGV